MSPQKKVRGCGQWARPESWRPWPTGTDATFFHAGLAKLPGLLGVAVQSGVRWRRAAESAFRTPSASRSVVYTGVPGCCRQESFNPPASTASKPSSSTSYRTTALAFASSPARQFDQAIHEADRVRADGAHRCGDGAPVGDTTFNNGGATHDMVTNLHEDWISATQSTNGVAVNPGAPDGGTERIDPTTTASGVVIKFDGIGNSEDLVLILDLKDANGNEITRAVNVQNSDLIKGNANVPFPYNTEFTLDNNDALLIIEQNDYTVAGETYQIQGIQIMHSANG